MSVSFAIDRAAHQHVSRRALEGLDDGPVLPVLDRCSHCGSLYSSSYPIGAVHPTDSDRRWNGRNWVTIY